MKTLLIAAALLIGCEPKPQQPTPKPTRPQEPAPWITISVESEEEMPDSPEQVCITVKTRDGKKWAAVWEEQARR